RARPGAVHAGHPLSALARQSDVHTAAVANDAPMLDPFVFAAGTFPVLDRTENAFAEQAALFRLEGAVIDRLRVLDLALRPDANGFGRSDADADVIHQVDCFQPK